MNRVDTDLPTPAGEQFSRQLRGLAAVGRQVAEGLETAVWGGSVGQAERWRNDSTRRVRHRREVATARRRQHNRRLALFAVLAVPGLVLLALCITASGLNPWWRLIAGVLLVLPLLMEGMYYA